MDILLFVLQFLFLAPLVFRLVSRETPQTNVFRELASTFRTSGLFLHLVGLIFVWTGFGIRFWTVGVERSVTAAGLTGNILAVIATALMFWAFAVFRSWRLLPRIDRGHELCTAGPYALVRHPIYLALDLLGMGVAVAVPSVMVIAGAVLLIIGTEIRSRQEERALLQVFGERYLGYMKRVRRTIPGIY